MSAHEEERLAALLRELTPAPAGWVRAAQELPAARAAMDALVERAMASERCRRQVLSGLEEALAQAGVVPDRRSVTELRARLAERREEG